MTWRVNTSPASLSTPGRITKAGEREAAYRLGAACGRWAAAQPPPARLGTARDHTRRVHAPNAPTDANTCPTRRVPSGTGRSGTAYTHAGAHTRAALSPDRFSADLRTRTILESSRNEGHDTLIARSVPPLSRRSMSRRRTGDWRTPTRPVRRRGALWRRGMRGWAGDIETAPTWRASGARESLRARTGSWHGGAAVGS